MKNKKLWLGILVIVLVFGMAVVGCDDVSTNDSTGTQNLGGGGEHIHSWLRYEASPCGSFRYCQGCGEELVYNNLGHNINVNTGKCSCGRQYYPSYF